MRIKWKSKSNIVYNKNLGRNGTITQRLSVLCFFFVFVFHLQIVSIWVGLNWFIANHIMNTEWLKTKKQLSLVLLRYFIVIIHIWDLHLWRKKILQTNSIIEMMFISSSSSINSSFLFRYKRILLYIYVYFLNSFTRPKL